MVDNVQLNGPIEIKDNSAERVAYDLMTRIAHAESGTSIDPNRDVRDAQKKRDYWLTLYAESYRVVNGHSYPPKD